MDRMMASGGRVHAAAHARGSTCDRLPHTSVGDSVKGARARRARPARRRRTCELAQPRLAQALYALGLARESTDPEEAAERSPTLGRRRQRRGQPVDRGLRAHGGPAGSRRAKAKPQRSARPLRRRDRDLVPRRRLGQPMAVAAPRIRDTSCNSGPIWARRRCTARSLRRARRTPCLSRPPTRSTSLRSSAEVRERLGAAAFASAVRRGATLGDAEIIEFVREQIQALASATS